MKHETNNDYERKQIMKKTSLCTKLTLLVLAACAFTTVAEDRKISQVALKTTPPTAPGCTVQPTTNGNPFFAVLYGKNNKVLGTNLEYSATHLLRVCFREVGSGRPVAFDVEELHHSVLASLDIDPWAQKEKALRQKRAWEDKDNLDLQRQEQERREKLFREILKRSILIRIHKTQS
jgi:hypothetical protein